MVQEAADARAAPQLVVSAKSLALVPRTLIPLMLMLEDVELVRVKVCAAVATPTDCEPKLNVEGESITVGSSTYARSLVISVLAIPNPPPVPKLAVVIAYPKDGPGKVMGVWKVPPPIPRATPTIPPSSVVHAISMFPSAFRSAAVIAQLDEPTAWAWAVWKVPSPLPSRTYTLSSDWLLATISSFPSPLKSAIAA